MPSREFPWGISARACPFRATALDPAMLPLVIAALSLTLPPEGSRSVQLRIENLLARAYDQVTTPQAVVFLLVEGVEQRDLNGDGDQSDTLPYAHDFRRGETRPLGVACDRVLFAQGSWVALEGAERDARTDLNGDGDELDVVLWFYDTLHRRRVDTGLAILTDVVFGEGLAFFGVSEEAQGQDDRNGDGDASDFVLEAFEFSSLRLLTSSRAAGSFQACGEFVAYSVPEQGQGVDLNGDGDRADLVVHLSRLSTGVSMNLRRACSTRPLQFQGRHLLYNVSETAQGEDLNHDGDVLDTVWEVFDVTRGSVRCTGLASSQAFLGESVLGISVDEAASGQDLNGDGDAFDHVMHAGPSSGVGLSNQGVTTRDGRVSGGALAWIVDERVHKKDMNGDGDLVDFVPHYWRAGGTVGMPYAGFSFALGPRHLVQLALEGGSGGIDIDGNGRNTDQVLVLRELATGREDILGHGASFAALHGNWLFYSLIEGSQGLDLNADGDQLDIVLQLRDLARGHSTNSGLATANGLNHWRFAPEAPFLFRVPEPFQGVDLNGDGVLSGDILHAVFELPHR